MRRCADALGIELIHNRFVGHFEGVREASSFLWGGDHMDCRQVVASNSPLELARRTQVHCKGGVFINITRYYLSQLRILMTANLYLITAESIVVSCDCLEVTHLPCLSAS